MLQSETPSFNKTKTTKSEPKQSLIRADLNPICTGLFLQPISTGGGVDSTPPSKKG